MKAALIVLDGLGVGAMDDVEQVRPQDKRANTLQRVFEQMDGASIPNLMKLGLGNILPPSPHYVFDGAVQASYGRCRLAHPGADSYLGHQEIMGTIPPPPIKTLMSAVVDELRGQLQAHGYRVSSPVPDKSLLLVEGAIVIGDNLEADPGQNINLTVPVDDIDFDEAVKVGHIVRNTVKVARVIVFGGPGITVSDILSHVHVRDNGQVGIDSPSLGVYDEHLQVQHMGYGVDPTRQVPQILQAVGYPVTLIGKMADVITCPGAAKNPLVPTRQVMAAVHEAFLDMDQGLITATVQETDLAGHEGDSRRIASILAQVDEALGRLVPLVEEDDMLIICADHGNDPTINVGFHTREETPLLVYQPQYSAYPLGIRDTLADIGATISGHFGVPNPQDGLAVLGPSRGPQER